MIRLTLTSTQLALLVELLNGYRAMLEEEIRRGATTTKSGVIKFGATETFNAWQLLIDTEATFEAVAE